MLFTVYSVYVEAVQLSQEARIYMASVQSQEDIGATIHWKKFKDHLSWSKSRTGE
jgi:hypothetical protein